MLELKILHCWAHFSCRLIEVSSRVLSGGVLQDEVLRLPNLHRRDWQEPQHKTD